ncbi:hypothetical protein Taro_025848 [Colocasia esculenta]|uniref:Aminotransferase-like plant mobile domain-containing protein n=1 Tax=Colocasia esculenta TaxID=4460 RepID=A0A843VLR9_COLES|nr:hypothetical protein [Colocasia esculenta]
MGEYIAVRVEDDKTVESMFDLYPSHVSTVQLYLEKEDIDNISIQGNDEVQTHGHIDDNLHTQHYEYQQPTGHFTRMLNDDVDSTRFYSANERYVRSIGYGGGSSQYLFMSITDPSHTFHSASSSRHHVTEEHVIEEDEEDEIDSQDDIDDNEKMMNHYLILPGWNVPRVEINNPRHVLRLYRSELDHQEDYHVRWEPYTSDILEMLPVVSRQASHLWLSRVPLLSFSIVEMHVPDRVLRQFGRVQHIPGPVDALDRVTRKRRGHIDWGRYFAHFVQMWHRRTDYIIPSDEESVGIGRVEYMAWYWSITRRYIGRPGFTYDMCYESRDHIERSLVEGMKHLHMMATDGLQDDISDSMQSQFIAMQMYIDGVLSHVQRTDSSTSHAGPSEPCADTPQQPDDAGPSHCSPDVMTVSQYGLYDIRASQILTDAGMTDTQPPQSTVGTYRRQRRHRGSNSTLPQQSQSDLLGETLGSISEDMDSETAQSESCDAILVHETQSQSETEEKARLALMNMPCPELGVDPTQEGSAMEVDDNG